MQHIKKQNITKIKTNNNYEIYSIKLSASIATCNNR